MTFEESIFTHEFKLNDTDNCIIEYIKKNKNRLSGLSIHKMAAELFISPNAIMRTAKKLGYSGFSELKFSLQSESINEEEHNNHDHIIEKIPANILKTIDIIDEHQLDMLVDEIILLNNILIVGNGEYSYYCDMLYQGLKCINKNVNYFDTLEQTGFSAKRCTTDDLIIICDSEKSEASINIAIHAKESNIPCFCLTHSGEHSISKICRHHLFYWCESKIINKCDVTDRTGLIILIRKICERYWFKATHK